MYAAYEIVLGQRVKATYFHSILFSSYSSIAGIKVDYDLPCLLCL